MQTVCYCLIPNAMKDDKKTFLILSFKQNPPCVSNPILSDFHADAAPK